MRQETIRKLIYDVLLEAEQGFETASAESMTSASRLSDISVDSQIDSYILGFEKESVMSDDDTLSESLSSGSLRALLLEADPLDLGDDDAGADADADADADSGADAEAEEDEPEVPEPGDDSEPKSTEPQSLPMPKINVETFTDKVMRLSMNAEQMLDPASVVINRAKKFLIDNYDKAHLEAFENFLETNYDLNDMIGQGEAPEAPFALGANPAGAGNMGGGA